MLWTILVMSVREIRRNKLRSVLTMLGIVIGVAAVIALVTIGQGASRQITTDIAKLGDNLLVVSAGSHRRGGSSVLAAPLETEDAEAIAREVTGVRAVAPAAWRNLLAVYGNENWRTSVIGATESYFAARNLAIERGRGLTEADRTAGKPVCVIGSTPAEELFGAADPIGMTLRIDRMTCEVVGLLRSKGQMAIGSDQDDLIVMPLATFHRRIAGNRDLSHILVSAARGRPTTLVKTQIEALMRERRRVGDTDEDNFTVRDMQEITETLQGVTGVLTALLGAIAAVSLLVGGIGIMNIMLVSVTERTREIGIRLAIGARTRDVLLQFLVEAVVLSTVGGVIGVLVGLAGSLAAVRALDLPFVVVPDVILLAFVFSAAVGVGFGFLPARKAAHLDPIDALRHE